MAPDASEQLPFPPALQARLDAAGVTDDATLQAALERDPQLRAEFEAFLQENPEWLAALQMNALLQTFAEVENNEQMLELGGQSTKGDDHGNPIQTLTEAPGDHPE